MSKPAGFLSRRELVKLSALGMVVPNLLAGALPSGRPPAKNSRLLQMGMHLGTQQMFGLDVEELGPGVPESIDRSSTGYPLASIEQIPPGDYFVQRFLNRSIGTKVRKVPRDFAQPIGPKQLVQTQWIPRFRFICALIFGGLENHLSLV